MSEDGTLKPSQLITPTVLHILLSLAEEDRHGAGIKSAVEERTEGSLNLGPATLYEAIHRLERSGWIAVTQPPDRAQGRGNHRKYYRLTKAGRGELNAELQRLDEIVHFAKARRIFWESGSA